MRPPELLLDARLELVKALPGTPKRASCIFVDIHAGDLYRVPPELGWPDGMTSDAEGMLWIALWGGAGVARWDPAAGRLLAAYPLPALSVASCCFGGAHLADLYITAARKGFLRDLSDFFALFAASRFNLFTLPPTSLPPRPSNCAKITP